MKALVVDDNPTLLKTTSNCLHFRNYDVTSVLFPSGNIPSDRFDLAVVDVLEGDVESILGRVDAERKVVYAEVGKVKIAGVEVYDKAIPLRDILGEIR